MDRKFKILVLAAGAACLTAACAQTDMGGNKGGAAAGSDGSNPMSFFVTSANPGNGADLGGLAGADRYCQQLAQNVGAGGKTWRAYLSTVATSGGPAVDARDRIGSGPWKNAKGETIATSVADLHGANNNLTKQTALTEKGEVLAGRGDAVNMHDILTGSNADGTAATPSAGADATCGNWTKGGADGAAIVGHHDRVGLNESPPMKSWNSSHPSRGCSLDALKTSGGNGRFYCFAAN